MFVRYPGSEILLKRIVFFLLRYINGFYPQSTQTKAWQSVLQQYRQKSSTALNEHEKTWWSTAGYALAELMHKAGYTREAEEKHLQFFASVVIPSLGIANPRDRSWHSFMTDDGTPIELSWDWGYGRPSDRAPVIRYSLEPVGLDAGRSSDPHNHLEPTRFHTRIATALPKTAAEWYNHFHNFFDTPGLAPPPLSVLDTQGSQIFYALDLLDQDLVSKAYFFPSRRAHAQGISHFDVITQAVATAPGAGPEDPAGLSMFRDYVTTTDATTMAPLELDMLSIDMVGPRQSRLKVYFRSRSTSFASVQDAMTLGHRLSLPSSTSQASLDQLRELFRAVLGLPSDYADTKPLAPANSHRTAGILFNVEFRLGNAQLPPKVKIYIPVRHYASSDGAIHQGLKAFLIRHGRTAYLGPYEHAIQTIL